MLTRQFSFTALILFIIYIVQESVMSQVRLPFGGFSLLLTFTLIWAALSTPINGALTGFISGIFMDLSQSTDGPMGHWTLLMIIICYAIAFLGYGDDSSRGNPLTIVFLTSAASIASLTFFVISGKLLGLEFGSLGRVLATLVGNGLWTLAVSPFLLPVVIPLHRLLFNSQAKL